MDPSDYLDADQLVRLIAAQAAGPVQDSTRYAADNVITVARWILDGDS